jgi:hypothetical protein
MYRRPAGSEEALASVEQKAGVRFPSDYREFILESNGGNGDPAGVAYVDLFPVDKLLEETSEYGIPAGFLLLGSNGGGEGIVLTMRSGEPVLGYLPLISSDPSEFRPVGRRLVDLLTTNFSSLRKIP